MTTTILLVDLSSVFWRGWHATAEEPDGSAAERITLSKIRETAQGYDHVAICIDSPKSWRRDLEPTYKANREAKPKGALDQLKRCQGILQADGYPILGADGYEADDVIATSVAWLVDAIEGEYRISIYSSDKDLLACLGEGVERISVATGEVMTADDVYKKHGIEPAEVPHWLALMGDASDNIRGVHRVGGKVAAKLVAEHSGVQGVIDAVTNDPDQFTPALRGNIIEARTWLPTSLRLSTLNADAPINCAAILQPRVMQPLETTIMDEPAAEEIDPQPQQAPAVRESEPEAFERGNGLAVRDATWERGLEPTTLREAYKLALVAFNSRMFSAYGNAEAVMMTILAGRSLGLDAMLALRSIALIKGKPTLSAQLMMGLCLRHPACEYFALVESSSERATYETKRTGNPTETRITWTMADAKRAKLGGDNWQKYPAAMLRARCVADLARAVYPDATHNVYVEGEL